MELTEVSHINWHITEILRKKWEIVSIGFNEPVAYGKIASK